MKIGIVGPGAMGCLLGGMMVQAGLEVVLLDHRPDRADHIRRRGLLLEDGPERIRVPAVVTLEPLDLSGVDLALICVKAYDTEVVARRLAALDPPPYFLTLQNGVGMWSCWAHGCLGKGCWPASPPTGPPPWDPGGPATRAVETLLLAQGSLKRWKIRIPGFKWPGTP